MRGGALRLQNAAGPCGASASASCSCPMPPCLPGCPPCCSIPDPLFRDVTIRGFWLMTWTKRWGLPASLRGMPCPALFAACH